MTYLRCQLSITSSQQTFTYFACIKRNFRDAWDGFVSNCLNMLFLEPLTPWRTTCGEMCTDVFLLCTSNAHKVILAILTGQYPIQSTFTKILEDSVVNIPYLLRIKKLTKLVLFYNFPGGYKCNHWSYFWIPLIVSSLYCLSRLNQQLL